MVFPLVTLLLLLKEVTSIIGVTGARIPKPATNVAFEVIFVMSAMCRCPHIFKRNSQLDKQTTANSPTLHTMILTLTLVLALILPHLILALVPILHPLPLIIILPLPSHPPQIIGKLTTLSLIVFFSFSGGYLASRQVGVLNFLLFILHVRLTASQLALCGE